MTMHAWEYIKSVLLPLFPVSYSKTKFFQCFFQNKKVMSVDPNIVTNIVSFIIVMIGFNQFNLHRIFKLFGKFPINSNYVKHFECCLNFCIDDGSFQAVPKPFISSTQVIRSKRSCRIFIVQCQNKNCFRKI